MSYDYSPIGVFDSGYGGLTILKELKNRLSGYDFIYLGDNARTPYGARSFEVVYDYTLEAVKFLFSKGCPLVILACNTASAKALRNGHIGVLGTVGTVISESYPVELAKWSNGRVISTVQEACPMWVPIVENNEINTPGANYFIQKNIRSILKKDPYLDTLILACTHYPLLIEQIKKFTPLGINILEQSMIVSDSLRDYLRRHPEMEKRISGKGTIRYMTTESTSVFETKAGFFLGQPVTAEHVVLS